MSQMSLKAQDIVIAIKIAVSLQQGFTYAGMGASVGLPPSRAHASVKMLLRARLALASPQAGIEIIRTRLLELLIYGVPYFFPPVIGGPTTGMPTASASPELQLDLIGTRKERYMWPFPDGVERGIALLPIHPCAVHASKEDQNVYLALMAIDTLRVDGAREREMAISVLRRILQ
jgi:hypothetical protein